MKVLLSIILLHFLVMFRSKHAANDGVPYLTTFIITVIMVALVLVMMYTMDAPEL